MRYEEFSQDYTSATGKTNLRQLINDAQNRLNGFRQWPWLVKSATLTGTGERALALPANFQTEIRVIDPDQRREIEVLPYTEFLDRYPVLIATGSPIKAAFQDQNHIVLEPALTSGNTVTLWYIREMPELIADSDVPDVPNPILNAYCRALIEYSLVDMFEYKQNLSAAQRQETVKVPIALHELKKIAGAGNSSIQVRESHASRRVLPYPVMPATVPAPS